MATRVYVLTTSEAVADQVRRRARPDDIVARVACLARLGSRASGASVVIDLQALQSCCCSVLLTWHRKKTLPKIILFHPPGSNESIVEGRKEGVPASERRLASRAQSSSRSQARMAWRNRERLFADIPRDCRPRLLLDLARRHAHHCLHEGQAAAAIHLGVRQLSRLSTHWFGYSPRIIITLFRVESVAGSLRVPGSSLTDIARHHGYSSRQAMSRQFQEFTSMRPSEYRALLR